MIKKSIKLLSFAICIVAVMTMLVFPASAWYSFGGPTYMSYTYPDTYNYDVAAHAGSELNPVAACACLGYEQFGIYFGVDVDNASSVNPGAVMAVAYGGMDHYQKESVTADGTWAEDDYGYHYY